MEVTPTQSTIVRFGLFEADLRRRELRKDGVRFKLHDQPFQILVLLLERTGEVVTREEIRQTLWPGNTFVEFDNGLNVAVKKLRTALSDDADNPRFIETVPRRGYRFVASVSVVSSAPAVSAQTPSGAAVENSSVEPPAFVISGQTKASGEKPAKRNRLVIASMLALLILTSIAIYRWRASLAARALAKSTAISQIIPRRSVAVLGFRNLPGRPEDDWLSAAFSEMLSTELAAGGGLRMIPEEDISRVKRDFRLGDADTLSKSTLSNLRINPGADVVVVGSCTPIEEKGVKRIRVDIRLQDTASGETIAEEAVTGAEGSLFEVASEAGTRLRERLGANASAEAMNAARASLPSNQQAERLYAEGRAKLWDFDFLAARDLLTKAVAADPENAAAHSALAAAWANLGYITTAQEQAKQAVDLSSRLSREEQLSVEGRYREFTFDWPKAIEIYRALTQFYPDNLDYGLHLSTVLSKGGRSEDSLLAVAALRRLPKPFSDDPRIDLREAYTYDHAGDYQKLQTAAANAAAKAQKRGSRALLAETKLQQSLAASRVNDPKAALTLVEEAQEIYKEVGDKYGSSRAQYRMADLLFNQGEFAQSNALLEHSLQVFRALGSEGDVAETLNDIAGGLFEMGDLAKSREMYEAALASQREVRSKRGIAETLTNLGTLLEQQGDLAVARKYDEEALAIDNELGEKGAIAAVQNNMGQVLFDQGDLSGGKSYWEQSLALRRELGNESDAAESLHNIARALGEQGDIAGAQKLFDEALAIQTNRGEQGNVAGTRLSKAELILETGNPADSEALIRSSLEQFQKEKQVQQEISAHDTLAQALLDLDRLPEAKTEIAQAIKMAGRNQSFGIRMKTEIVSAEVLSASGKTGDAIISLRATIKSSRGAGFLISQLEAAMALAEAEARAGKKNDSRDVIESVEKEAHEKAILLIARKAASIAARYRLEQRVISQPVSD